MSLRGALSEDERRYLERKVNRLSSVYEVLAKGNPLKPEEIKFIKEVLKELQEKPLEEFDLSKLEKIVEIADKLTVENGDKLAFEFWAKVYALYAIVRTQK
jgi:uncharacterized protein YfkK (UPF0435 family)